ncbi:MAG: alpha/beta hydrolase [Clostridiales bacterium]|nr:alpha/beta hydrolase [Clostridiales bacterium]
MYRDLIGKIIIPVLLLAMLASCSKAPDMTSATTTTEVTTTARSETATSETTTAPLPSDPEIKEESETVKRVVFYRDGNPVKAKVYLPEGEGPFKTVVIVGGMYIDLGYYSGKADIMNGNGYAVVEVSPSNNKLTGVYQLPEYMGDFVYEQMQDLLYVMDDLEMFPEIDQDNIYLFGHSVGGLTTLYAGAERQASIKGLILVEPSFQYPETMLFEKDQKLRTDLYPLLSEIKVPVLIVKGTGDRPDLEDFPHFYDKAVEAVPNAELVTIEGADHPMRGEPGNEMARTVCQYIEKW